MERKTNKVVVGAIKPGDLMLVGYYVKVQSVGRDSMVVDDVDHGIRDIRVTGREILESTLSADQFHATVKTTQTELAEILTTTHNTPFTVCFTKADGTERNLRGRFIASETLMGRSKVEDLDHPKGDRFRLVDHRNIKSLIVRGVKYVVK